MLSRFTKRLSPLHAAAIVIPAAVLAAAVAVGPSFAGSFLTPQKAAHTYLTKKKAKSVYLKNKQASRSYVAKPDAPVAATAANTAPFGPTPRATTQSTFRAPTSASRCRRRALCR